MYAILVVETADGKLKLYGCHSDSLDDAEEISEINGRCLDNWPLADIADYIQRCIHSRTLCFNIKPKRTPDKVVGDVVIRDTFVIWVGGEEDDVTQHPLAPPLHNGHTETTQVCEIKRTVVPSPVGATVDPSPIDEDAMKDPAKINANLANDHRHNNNNEESTNNNNDTTMVPIPQAPRHRERAIDVPDSFVATTKTPPRYPPPRKRPPALPPDATCSLRKQGAYRFGGEEPPRHARSLSSPPHEDCSPREEEERRTPPTPRISEVVMRTEGKEEEEVDRIRKYQDELRKRKEDEERLAREDEFLRSSLRGSKKLRALEKASDGNENSAFQPEETTDSVVATSGTTELTRNYDASELLQMLRNVECSLSGSGFGESLVGVEKLFLSGQFRGQLRLHNALQDLCCFRCLPNPLCTDAEVLALEVRRSLEEVPSKDAQELLRILCEGSLDSLLWCHDRVGCSRSVPELTEEEELLTKISDYTEDSIKIVRVQKTAEPLGATVRNEGEAVIIGRIVKGGVAEKTGLLHEGDEILAVNGLELRGSSVNDVCDIMASLSGVLTFFIVPSQFENPKTPTRESVMHLKAHFDYEPEDDLYVPCRELGLGFQKGDVLHVICQEDPNWWQAYREGEEDQVLAGLIPSNNFQQQREIVKQAVVGDSRERKSKKGSFLCVKRYHRRKKKKLYNLNYNDDMDSDRVLTYEEVRLYYPRAHQKRPLVLIGPQKVGRHELRQRLMEDGERFAAAVPHTSRPKKESELNGVDYFFISRSQFEADIVSGRFVEHGEYQKSYYGTSLDAIRSVIDSGKTCVLNLHPQSLKILKKSDLMPYVVFVAPPSLDKLRQNCLKTDATVKDEELKEIIEKAREMEELFGHCFDLVLINVDLEKTYSELLHEISVIEREPQWVPAHWIKDLDDPS